ncbi:hypothetical protein LTS18_014468, partial [Coniosporium uncinatum]
MAAPVTFRLNFVGDVMLGRLIDQLMPAHVNEPSEAQTAHMLMQRRPELRGYNVNIPWGNSLPLFEEGDLNLINLETAVTAHHKKWPNKVFNYRMHPDNAKSLHVPRIDYAGLANNHTLDFSRNGLLETVKTLKDAGIKYAGAGSDREEATAPAVLQLSRNSERGGNKAHYVHVFAAADHPQDWAAESGFNFIEYSRATRARLKAEITKKRDTVPSLKVFSVHWGPNYSWQPAKDIRSLAHFLIDECGVDLIHGHSSHQVQGVERYKGKLIIYG